MMNSTLKLPSRFRLLGSSTPLRVTEDCALDIGGNIPGAKLLLTSYIFQILLSSVILSVVEEQVKPIIEKMQMVSYPAASVILSVVEGRVKPIIEKLQMC